MNCLVVKLYNVSITNNTNLIRVFLRNPSYTFAVNGRYVLQIGGLEEKMVFVSNVY